MKVLILCLLLMSVPVLAQEGESYTDPEGRFEVRLPANWKAVSYKDGAGNNRVDIVYRDRAYGLLKITLEKLPDADLQSFIQNEIDQNLRFRPGYVYNSTERFVGAHTRGSLLEFEFSLAGKAKKGRNYYVMAKDDSSVWVLRFTGNREILGPLRHDTDSIARSFKPIK